jgi:predicted RNase H-like HicB family nuclease
MAGLLICQRKLAPLFLEVDKDKNVMKSLANYSYLTIRISRLRTSRPDNTNGKNYLFVVRTDEIPGCSAHGSTIAEALNNFQKTAEVWLKWFNDSPHNNDKSSPPYTD